MLFFQSIQGMPDQKKLEAIIHLEKGKSKTFEWTLNTKKTGYVDVHEVRFGKVAFMKSFDGRYFNCKTYVYKLDFTLATNAALSDNNTIIYGLSSLFNSGKVENERDITKNDLVRFQNYIKHKALLEFQKEGLNDNISETDQQEGKT